MSCTKDGPISIIKGTDHSLRVELENEDGTAFDLTGTTELTLAFPSNGPEGSGKLTLLDGLSIIMPRELGAFTATLSSSFTTNLIVGKKQSFETKILKNGKIYKVQFIELLNVTNTIS